MGRKPSIWFRKQNKTWYFKYHGGQINLGKDKAAAEKEFHRLLSLDAPVADDPLAVEILDRFLTWVKENRSERTFEWYERAIQSFVDALPNQRILARDVRPKHVTDWLTPTWSVTTKRGAMVAIQRAFKWSMQQGYIDSTPMAHLEKPAPRRRENCPSEAEYKQILANAKGDFRDVIEFVWLTGARAHEVIIMEPRHFTGERIQFPVIESKGKKRSRVIYLPEKALEIIKRRVEKNPKFVFENRKGNPWHSNSFNCGMQRVEKKIGKKFSITDLRHGFCDRMIMSGVDHTIVAAMMGHADASMVQKQYSHIGQRADFVDEVVKKYA